MMVAPGWHSYNDLRPMLLVLLQDLVLARSGCRVVVDVPRALMISQLLQGSAAGFPMTITVTILESAGEGE